MAKQDRYAELADKIVDLLGGKSNISYFTHCVTRLRFNVKDKGLVDVNRIAQLPGAVGAQWSGDQLQIIIGQDVDEAYDLICKTHGLDRQEAVDAGDEDASKEGKKGFSINPKKILEAVTQCILPVVPAMMGPALIKVVATLFNLAGILPADSSTYLIICALSDAALYFMPIIVGYSAANYFKSSPAITMGLCALLVFSSFETGITEGTMTDIFGLPVYAATYGNMLFPSILIAWVTSYVERFFKSHLPKMLEYMCTPALTMVVMLPLMLVVLAPLGSIIGSAITSVCLFLYEQVGFVSVGLLTAIFPLLVITGMHYATIPAMTTCYIMWQKDPLVYPAMTIYNFCQAAAAAGVMLKAKRADIKTTSAGVAVTALLAGVTEPTLFGISLRYKTPLVASVIGGFVGGCLFGLFGCAMFAGGGTGVLSVIGFIGPDPMLFVYAVGSIIVAMLVTLVLTFVLFKEPADETDLSLEV